MQLTVDQKGQALVLTQFNLNDIEQALHHLNSIDNAYVILENENEDYIQCAGAAARLELEWRRYVEKGFKHYLIGHPEVSTVWTKIYCSVGPISILENEVLTVTEALELFTCFYHHQALPDYYHQRDIAEEFPQTW